MLLGLDSFSEMLRFSENLQSIAVSDTQIMENLRAQEQTLEQQAAQEQQQMTQAQAEKESYEKASA